MVGSRNTASSGLPALDPLRPLMSAAYFLNINRQAEVATFTQPNSTVQKRTDPQRTVAHYSLGFGLLIALDLYWPVATLSIAGL